MDIIDTTAETVPAVEETPAVEELPAVNHQRLTRAEDKRRRRAARALALISRIPTKPKSQRGT